VDLLFLVFYFLSRSVADIASFIGLWSFLNARLSVCEYLGNAGASGGAQLLFYPGTVDCDYSFKSRRYNNHRDSVVFVLSPELLFLLEQMRS